MKFFPPKKRKRKQFLNYGKNVFLEDAKSTNSAPRVSRKQVLISFVNTLSIMIHYFETRLGNKNSLFDALRLFVKLFVFRFEWLSKQTQRLAYDFIMTGILSF